MDVRLSGEAAAGALSSWAGRGWCLGEILGSWAVQGRPKGTVEALRIFLEANGQEWENSVKG